MIYLNSFYLPDQSQEANAFSVTSPTYYNTLYPFQLFPQKHLTHIEFSDITIFCGSNGSGKSTLLNVISEKLSLKRGCQFNKTELYDKYESFTSEDSLIPREVREKSKIITSDDVFNHILDVRERNRNIDFKRLAILQQRRQYIDDPDSRPREIDFSKPETFQKYRDCAEMINKSKSASTIVKSQLGFNERTYSNGENAFKYFTDAIQPGGLYLLDEPENSISPMLQLDLADFLAAMARFYECQLIISTHSPILLAIPFARIYNMDADPVSCCKWTDLPQVKAYHDFFKRHENDFR